MGKYEKSIHFFFVHFVFFYYFSGCNSLMANCRRIAYHATSWEVQVVLLDVQLLEQAYEKKILKFWISRFSVLV